MIDLYIELHVLKQSMENNAACITVHYKMFWGSIKKKHFFQKQKF